MYKLSTSQKNKFNDQLKGEHDLAAIGLLVVPLVEKHFQDFDGERCTIASGARSAKFDKICKAFQDEVKELTGVNVWVDASYSASVRLKIDQPSSNRDYGCNYFEDSIYFGEIDNNSFARVPSGLFTYKFNPYAINGIVEKYKVIQAVTLKQLIQAKNDVNQAKEALESALKAVPYTFKDLIK